MKAKKEEVAVVENTKGCAINWELLDDDTECAIDRDAYWRGYADAYCLSPAARRANRNQLS